MQSLIEQQLGEAASAEDSAEEGGAEDEPQERVLEGEGGLVDAYAGFRDDAKGPPPATCWTGVRLDYVMLSSSPCDTSTIRVDARPVTIEDATCSDHMPVVCDLVVE